MSLSIRFGNIRPFANVHTRENDTYGGVQLGFTTYGTDDSGEETYATSYAEWGGRSDHVYDLLSGPCGLDDAVRHVSTTDCDTPYVGTVEENERVKSRRSRPSAA